MHEGAFAPLLLRPMSDDVSTNLWKLLEWTEDSGHKCLNLLERIVQRECVLVMAQEGNFVNQRVKLFCLLEGQGTAFYRNRSQWLHLLGRAIPYRLPSEP